MPRSNTSTARVKPLTPQKKSFFLALLCRNESLLRQFQGRLHPAEFPETDRAYAVFLTALFSAYGEQEKLPHPDILREHVQDTVDASLSGRVTADEADLIDEILENAFDDREYFAAPPTTEEHYRLGLKLGKRLLNEYLSHRTTQELIRHGKSHTNLPELLEMQFDQARRIEQIGVSGGEEFFPDGWDMVTVRETVPTNITFLDEYLRGGSVAGEIYGLLGPYGSCKTTLAIMATVEGAKIAASQEDRRGKVGLSFYFSYEAPIEEIRIRSLAYCGRIQRESLEQMQGRGMRALSRKDSLRPYEEEMFAAELSSGEAVPGEYIRAKRAIRLLGKHMVPVDFTGSTRSKRGPSAGGGYVNEISQVIEAELLERGVESHYVHLVVIDYAGLMVDRYIESENLKTEQTRTLLKSAANRLKHRVANRYDCPIILLHQLSGEANSKSPGAKLSQTDAAECKSFAENLDFSFIVGQLTPDNLCQFANGKQRRAARKPPKILRVVGAFNRVDDVSDRYFLDQTNHSIRSKTESAVSDDDDAGIPDTGDFE